MSASTPGLHSNETFLEGLPLLRATPAGWEQIALGDVGRLLADHAHCEQKAACAALALVARYPQHPQLARPLLALAQEEIHHLREVLDRMERRGVPFTRPEPDRYVRELRSICCEGSRGLGAPTDLLIVDAFVEARSCERFRRLAAALAEEPGEARKTPDAPAMEDEAELATFYARLAAAECRHWEIFRDLAVTLQPSARVDARIAEVARAESDLIERLPLEPRMH